MEEAQRLGFLGPGQIESHLRHSLGFAEALQLYWSSSSAGSEQEYAASPPVSPTGSEGHSASGIRILDLGSGGGVPGLVLAEYFPLVLVTLLDSAQRRCQFLEDCVEESKWIPRVEVLCARAEEVGRDPRYRGSFDAVVSRSFGPPAVAAECASPFLKQGGVLIVSEPPVSPEDLGKEDLNSEVANRWDPIGLERLGMREVEVLVSPFHFVLLRQEALCPERFPRRVGIPSKRPLF